MMTGGEDVGLIEALPHHKFEYGDHQKPANAYVFVDKNEVFILPLDGGCLFTSKTNFEGDAAPWAD